MAGFSLKLKYATQWATLVAATLAVLGGIAALGAYVQAHFATGKEVQYLDCISKQQFNLLAMQMEAENTYARYINTKVNLLELRENPDDSSEQPKDRIKLEEKSELLWNHVTQLRDKAIEYMKELEKCEAPNELIWLPS